MVVCICVTKNKHTGCIALWCSVFDFYGDKQKTIFIFSAIFDLEGLINFIMVKLHLKQGDESLFLYETTCQAELSELIPQLVRIQNGRLKIERLFYGKYKCKLKMTFYLYS